MHPSLWLASQLARGNARTVPTGYPSLDKELPGGGWPISCLTELLQPTEGEEIVSDYRSLGLTLNRHPLALLCHKLRDGEVPTRGIDCLPARCLWPVAMRRRGATPDRATLCRFVAYAWIPGHREQEFLLTVFSLPSSGRLSPT